MKQTRFLLAVAVVLSCSTVVPTPGADCTVYVYLDDQGSTVRTRNRAEIPPAKQSAVVSYQDCSADLGSSGKSAYVQSLEASAVQWIAVADEDWWQEFRGRLHGVRAILAILCLALFFAGLIGVAVAAFRAGILWGLAVLFVPVVPIVFVIVYWREARVPFFAWLAGWASLVAVVLWP